MATPRTKKPVERPDHKVQLIVAAALSAVGAALLVGGFWVAPRGEIHTSILVGFGEILTFVGAVFGVDYHYKAKE